jgi:type I restriction enzyme M protein
LILPRNLFYTTDISVTLWIINSNKGARTVEQNGKRKKYRNRIDEILFMDLRQMGIPFEKKYTQFSKGDSEKVTMTYHNWQEINFEKTYQNIPEFCFSETLEEITKKDFTLVPSKYIEFINLDENVDFDEKMTSLQLELAELLNAEKNSNNDILGVFKELGYEIKL